MFAFTKFLFFLTNYEAAKLGSMDLPIINGPSEGNFLIGILFILPIFYKKDIYDIQFG